MKLKFLNASLIGLLLTVCSSANAWLITSEDFESGTATDWSNNLVTVGNSNFTTFLGRHAGSNGNQYLSKTFALTGNQTEVNISFSFYEIDSWDNESLNIYINDILVRTDVYSVHAIDAPSGTTSLFTDNTSFGFTGSYYDQGIGYSFILNTTETSLKLGFGTTINQAINDESWGIDNVIIMDNIQGDPNMSVPEPTTLAIFTLGIIGLASRRLKKQS